MTEGGDTLIMALVAVLGYPTIVLIHELGHALACLALGARVERLRVGGEPQLTVSRGAFRLELSLEDGAGGFVEHGGGISFRRLAVIALAGPAAHLLAVAALVVLALDAGGTVAAALWFVAVVGLFSLVNNLVPRDLNDGHVALLSLSAAVLGIDPADVEPEPEEEVPGSFPPPAPAPEREGMRWPFAVVLGLVALLSLLMQMPLLTLALAVLFGGTYLSQRTTRVS